MRLRAILAIATLFSTPAFAAVKPCDLITTQIAATIFGAPTQPGAEYKIEGIGTSCVYRTSSGGEVSAFVIDGPSMGATPAQMFPIVTEPKTADEKAEPVPGLGDKCTLLASSTETAIFVLFHGKVLSLSAAGSKNPALKSALIAAAKQVLSRL